MTKEQRALFGISDSDWSAARDRCREAMTGGAVTYWSKRDPHGRNGQRATVVRVVKSTREIEIKWANDGKHFRAFAHNISLG